MGNVGGKDKKIRVGNVEYKIYEEAGSTRLVREKPFYGMRVENVFCSRPDSYERMVAFKRQAARLVMETVEKES